MTKLQGGPGQLRLPSSPAETSSSPAKRRRRRKLARQPPTCDATNGTDDTALHRHPRDRDGGNLCRIRYIIRVSSVTSAALFQFLQWIAPLVHCMFQMTVMNTLVLFLHLLCRVRSPSCLLHVSYVIHFMSMITMAQVNWILVPSLSIAVTLQLILSSVVAMLTHLLRRLLCLINNRQDFMIITILWPKTSGKLSPPTWCCTHGTLKETRNLNDIANDLCWDVLCLQEVAERFEAPGHMVVRCKADYRSIALVLHKRLIPYMATADDQMGFPMIRVVFRGIAFSIMSVYLPHPRSSLASWGSTTACEESGQGTSF